MKHYGVDGQVGLEETPFSILERIDVGETTLQPHAPTGPRRAFSILERIDVGETRRGEL